jgi:hypothetical protein
MKQEDFASAQEMLTWRLLADGLALIRRDTTASTQEVSK